jgi:hypothetical protein
MENVKTDHLRGHGTSTELIMPEEVKADNLRNGTELIVTEVVKADNLRGPR